MCERSRNADGQTRDKPDATWQEASRMIWQTFPFLQQQHLQLLAISILSAQAMIRPAPTHGGGGGNQLPPARRRWNASAVHFRMLSNEAVGGGGDDLNRSSAQSWGCHSVRDADWLARVAGDQNRGQIGQRCETRERVKRNQILVFLVHSGL
jgi:hypothetical protein